MDLPIKQEIFVLISQVSINALFEAELQSNLESEEQDICEEDLNEDVTPLLAKSFT